MNKKSEKARSWYERTDIAEFYSSFESEHLDRYRNLYIELAFAKLDLDKQIRVLDIGCGTGSGLAYMLKRWPSHTFVGIDPNEALLAKAAERLGSYASLYQHSIESTDVIQLGAFDLILSYSNLRLWSELLIGLKNISSLLSHEGLAYLLDLHRDVDDDLVDDVVNKMERLDHRQYFLDQFQASYTKSEVELLCKKAEIGNVDIKIGGLGGSDYRSREAFELIQKHEYLAEAVFALSDVKSGSATSAELVMHIFIEGK